MNNKLINHLEECIDLGFQWIEKIELESKNPPEGLAAFLNHYYRLVGEWEDQVKRGLPNNAPKREFSLAKSPDSNIDHLSSVPSDVQRLINSIKARINVLKDYKNELHSRSFILGPQARLNINSTDASTNIISDEISIINKLELEFEQNYKGTDKKALISLIQELKQNPEPKRRSKIVSKLLARGAQVAQIVSLIAQLIST